MKPPINRRDFLKLASLAPLGLASSQLAQSIHKPQKQQTGKQNVIVVVFDAFSATNISLYGYPRETTPNLAKLAERATVYHNHFSGANFTTPGTSSLLTGTLPWTHRAFNPNGKVAEQLVHRNIFNAFKSHYRLAYTHNTWADTLLNQFSIDMDELIPRESLFLTSDGLITALFKNDEDIASVSWSRNIKKKDDGAAYSLFLSQFYEWYRDRQEASLQATFPRGIPNIDGGNCFLLETAIDWLGKHLSTLSQPFMGYFHFLPPHYLYNTPKEFVDWFANDGYKPAEKPMDLFAMEKVGKNTLKRRTEYDEYILYVDREFRRFYDYLEKSGLVENTWVVLTSDHGEMFERNISGHLTPTLYQPLVRIPLLIFEPGQQTRRDVTSHTSAIDVLPTMLHVTGQDIPGWVEGRVLPPYAPVEQVADQVIYAVQARNNPQNRPFEEATIMMVKGRYKLIYYLGYSRLREDRGVNELIQLFDIESDPEELNDLSVSQKDIAAELLNELRAKLAEVNQPYSEN